MRIGMLLLLLLVTEALAAAQGWTLAAIRKRYAAAAALSPKKNTHTLTLRMVYAAIGIQTTRISFSFKARQKNPENYPYEMVSELYRIAVRYNVAASVQHRKEYLYSPSGALIFSLLEKRYGSGKGEAVRLYFSGGRLFRADRNVDGKRRVRVSGFLAKDRRQAAEALAGAIRYKRLFAAVERARAGR